MKPLKRYFNVHKRIKMSLTRKKICKKEIICYERYNCTQQDVFDNNNKILIMINMIA